ncbi:MULTISPECIES: anti-sigma-E factor RseA [unclassified Brenneria]|uniref:anti-sigma-E factor RseA n=1 Tax=unclassified Brenneria TaxID=2634434 RepID=UPI001554A9B5|nr:MULTISPECIES: anti-sigma-E factor RseA [unclassified Brenneria]MBJ7223280.1 anti-sigma-E factor RseA [Brenneria sp. L3-3C-1]MEE3644520.1 anti-sigma-E factor RseA [Brenneria sp. L3_3C_1]MEE3652081.1 anti-sigma-E factor RseA [Brenneria sp. HEZEL_4_2_4]NPD02042.1 anti-sigma-E factor RseA [Brenneria sp. hezel4-2-4]
MQKEKLSALMDGEAVDSELLNSLSRDDKLQQSWQSYHLIRDTLRGDIGEQVVHLDIASRVAAAIEKEPARLVPQSQPESQPHPDRWPQMPFWHKVRPWASQLTQVGVAACVSLAVIVGVQNYNQTGVADTVTESAAFSTLPAMGTASPVSLGVPSENIASHSGQQKSDVQRNRLNAILQDYELQRRLHAEQLQQHDDHQQAAIQVPGTQSLGTQPR